MNHKPLKTAFSPLRIALMVFIVLCLMASIISMLFHGHSWARYLGIFSTVFIMLTIFMQFLELVWLNSIRRKETALVKKSYTLAMQIYVLLLISGIIISILVLNQLV